ncbi:MAG: serine/threonine-protein kinase, partial [Planctomycetia bacterium]|nr:serine/threonine-protein kinase [Planctomycetia bacterium]
MSSDSNLSLNNLKTHAPISFSDVEIMELQSGRVVSGKYRLETCAGQGGMGVVWKAWDLVGERMVALKFVPAEIRRRDDVMEQVRKAFQTVQELNHQNICPIFALEKDMTLGYFIVIRWLEGKSLEELKNSPILRKNTQVLTILRSVATALDYAHARNVIHRDVKPSNIFITLKDGKFQDVLLIDFDLAYRMSEKVAQFSNQHISTSGTRPYMPPEQWRGEQQNARTDQYALAVVAYELYAGRRPFHAADMEMLRMCICQDLPTEIPGITPKMNVAIQKALAKDPAARFSSCTEFVRALEGKELSSSRARTGMGNKLGNRVGNEIWGENGLFTDKKKLQLAAIGGVTTLSVLLLVGTFLGRGEEEKAKTEIAASPEMILAVQETVRAEIRVGRAAVRAR